MNRLRQLSLGLQQYVELRKEVPPNHGPNAVGGWTYEILPFVEERSLFDSLSRGQSLIVSAEAPAHIASHRPLIFTCPTSDIELSRTTTIMAAHYVLTINDERTSGYLSEAPAGFTGPWISGPELPLGFESSNRGKGPHLGGYHRTSIFNTNVELVGEL